jgi:hypothetical protein
MLGFSIGPLLGGALTGRRVIFWLNLIGDNNTSSLR